MRSELFPTTAAIEELQPPATALHAHRPLHIVALAKQVPVAESLHLRSDGRLERQGAELEMNPYCRRAVAQGVTLAQASGGSCDVVTMGPASAEDVLREAVAWGATRGYHLCDDAFAGADTLATARALRAVIEQLAPVDLVLLGRSSIDGETGQVGPELAELLGLPFAAGVRAMSGRFPVLELHLEHEDRFVDVVVEAPAVLSVAERLCDPAKVPPAGRAAVEPSRIARLGAGDLVADQASAVARWGAAGSPTRVGGVRPVVHHRAAVVLDEDAGSLEERVARAVELLVARGANRSGQPGIHAGPLPPARTPGRGPGVGVLTAPGAQRIAQEILGAAARLAEAIGGHVVALGPTDRTGDDLGRWGADEVVAFAADLSEEDVAREVQEWARRTAPWAVLAPSTEYGRQVAGRVAAALEVGLVGDAVSLEVEHGRLVAAKPAFAGAVVADVTCTTALQMATVRPGVLPVPLPRDAVARRHVVRAAPRGRVRRTAEQWTDDIEVLARADVVVGVGTGVEPSEYPLLEPLVRALGAKVAATRKVTDRGWMARGRQVGITGRSIAPRLYVAVGLSGKFNHMAGVRAAGSILAINADPGAPVFHHADVGLVADWHQAAPLLARWWASRVPATADRAGSLEPSTS